MKAKTVNTKVVRFEIIVDYMVEVPKDWTPNLRHLLPLSEVFQELETNPNATYINSIVRFNAKLP